jgi:Na+-translocating ferredoxin:NAD+ oxidoreductase subunit C
MRRPSFRGGVHPREEKALSQDCALERMPPPAVLLLPVQQHLGRPAEACVAKGDFVREGQVIATAQGPISAAVHAPASGMISAVEIGATASAFPGLLIALKPGPPPPPKDGDEPLDASPLRLPPLSLAEATAEQIVERAREAGLVGQGGAAFPTAVKLSPPKDKPVEVLILNGCECEPYLTRDDRLMIERPAELLEGAALCARALGVGRVVIGVEDNKPRAIAALRQAITHESHGLRLSVLPLKTKYPQGAEKMLIEAVVGRRVPPGRLPMDVGAAIQNIATALALRDAVLEGRIPVEAVLTVSGRGLSRPANLIVPVGTPVADIIEHCGGFLPNASRVVVGGPMMGVAQHDLSAPVTKATSGILVLSEDEVEADPAKPCLRCGRCVEACPVQLVPSRLARLAELGRAEEARDQGIEVCMECGTCAFACPSRLPLVQWLRLGKQQARQLARSTG